MSKTLLSKILIRNDTTANWTANSTVVLGKGEIGIEWTTDGAAKLKIGDAVTTWANLSYYGNLITISGTGNTVVNAAQDATGTLTLTLGNRIESIVGSGVITASTSSNATTVSHSASGVTAGNYGNTSAQTPAFGGAFKTLYAVVNATGHVTSIAERSVTLPTLPADLVYDADIANMVTTSGTLISGQILTGDGTKATQASGYTISTAIGSTPSATAVPTEVAVVNKIEQTIGDMDAMVLVGSINGNGVIEAHNTTVVKQAIVDGTTNISGLTAYSAGWTWKVTSAGTITGIGTVEPGDQVIASNDFSTAYSASDWFIVQANVDVFVGASTTAAGTVGLVPAPAIMSSASDFKFLRNDGAWQTIAVPTIYTFTIQTSTTAANSNTVSVTYNPSSGAATYTIYKMKGADGTNPGYQGLVPAPAAADNNSMLFGDGTWVDTLVLDGGNSTTTY